MNANNPKQRFSDTTFILKDSIDNIFIFWQDFTLRVLKFTNTSFFLNKENNIVKSIESLSNLLILAHINIISTSLRYGFTPDFRHYYFEIAPCEYEHFSKKPFRGMFR